ncbi:MAG: 16S rRNA (cytosine(1402)-N(4))-methyltransferase RsmH [Chloroflexi bacterium]|nr:16S rRNA (cytosine(1402)-N(4))-methyltransferase RsmH [Chloroflexota bacterium]
MTALQGRHEPVLLAEVLDWLDVRPGRRFVDCTVGRGGHTQAILERGGEVLGIDADPLAIRETAARLTGRSRLRLAHGYFDEVARLSAGFAPVDGVLFDLGVSSPQLDDPGRGFSFSKDGPIDMRFDPEAGSPAAALVNEASVEELARIFRDYGEEPQPRKMARIVEAARPFHSTTQLAGAIEGAAMGRGRLHPATRVFQALRIATNRELDRLAAALDEALRLLCAGGRLVVITFHSLEDRLVKGFMTREARDCICPPRTPVCVCGHKASLRLLTRKPIVPEADEVRRNPRARSAKLRAAERI